MRLQIVRGFAGATLVAVTEEMTRAWHHRDHPDHDRTVGYYEQLCAEFPEPVIMIGTLNSAYGTDSEHYRTAGPREAVHHFLKVIDAKTGKMKSLAWEEYDMAGRVPGFIDPRVSQPRGCFSLW
jgi:hypothetical protein